ncbi:MAG: hypothetical protein PHE83_05705 [Opitutaceae bacterium]|nr:hypothetical protein [Opitutaceae bacterium]
MKFVNYRYGEAKGVMSTVIPGGHIWAQGFTAMASLRRAGLNMGQRISVLSLDRQPLRDRWYRLTRVR